MTIVHGIASGSSLGISRHTRRLADALAPLGLDYRVSARANRGHRNHFHLGNSSRGSLIEAPLLRLPYVVTVHDVLPRARSLRPLYRGYVYPLVIRRAARVVVHSRHAAGLLAEASGCAEEQLRVIPHPATVFRPLDRAAARSILRIPAGPPLVVLPGVINQAKLVRLAVDALGPLVETRALELLLLGRVVDHDAARAARAVGAHVLDLPDDETYGQAIQAADLVLVLRGGTVGESNGPLLDALGAGRAVVATASGSIPEVAGAAALYVATDVDAVRAGVTRLLEPSARISLETSALDRAKAQSWETAAAAYSQLFGEIWR